MWTTEKTSVAGWHNLNSTQKGTSETQRSEEKKFRRQGDGEDDDQAWICQVGLMVLIQHIWWSSDLAVLRYVLVRFLSLDMVDSWFNTTRKLLKSRRLIVKKGSNFSLISGSLLFSVVSMPWLKWVWTWSLTICEVVKSPKSLAGLLSLQSLLSSQRIILSKRRTWKHFQNH